MKLHDPICDPFRFFLRNPVATLFDYAPAHVLSNPLHGSKGDLSHAVGASIGEYRDGELLFGVNPALCARLRESAVVFEASAHPSKRGVAPHIFVDFFFRNGARVEGIVLVKPAQVNTFSASEQRVGKVDLLM